MNYSLNNIPDSGPNPVVWMDITLNEEVFGRIYIKLYREVFPAGVENFYHIASNSTYRIQTKTSGKRNFKKGTLRTYEGNKFFNLRYNNYVVTGDIYQNNGNSAGTIYCDQPIPPCFGNFYYPHDVKGLISLIPFKDATTGQLFYDSTFMITLDNVKPTNMLTELNCDQIVIGQIYDGIDVIDKMNNLIRPYAGRKYPAFKIGETGIYRNANTGRRPIQPITAIKRYHLINNEYCHGACPEKRDTCSYTCPDDNCEKNI